MSDGRSVFAVDRGIWADGDFAPEPFTEREAFMWLVSKAAWKDCALRGNTGWAVNLKRGEFSVAVRFVADQWQWTKDRAHRFIKRLEKRDMIRDESRDGAQIYSIRNYNRFQVVGLPDRDNESDAPRDDSATAARQTRDKEETGKQVNKETKKEESSLLSESPAKPLSRLSGKQEPEGFAEFYEAFPIKKDRPKAAKAYAGARKRGATVTILLQGALRYRLEREPQDPNFTKYPATWLNNDCWLDEPAPLKTFGGRNGGYQKPAQQSFAASLSRSIQGEPEERSLSPGGGEIIDITPSSHPEGDHEKAA